MSSNYSHRNENDSSSTSSSSSSSPDSSPRRSSSKYLGDDEQSSQHNYVPPQPMKNVFANDGSFLEMFKKYQEKEESVKKNETNASSESTTVSTSSSLSSSSSKIIKPVVGPMIGKRRGGKILPTGKVKKVKNEDDDSDDCNKQKDAWSVYMSEVKKYKETVCQSDDKTRPLVK